MNHLKTHSEKRSERRTENRIAKQAEKRAPVNAMALLHGGIYLISGLWPLIDMRSFESVTGPKADKWLVKTVGLLIATAGGVLLLSGANNRVSREVRQIAVGNALALGGVSLIYSLMGRISKIYLLDTLLEAALARGWAKASKK